MEYKVIGDVMQALQMQLRHGEEVFAEAGSMLYMDNGVELEARMQGGFVKGLMRKFLAGESMFMSVFRCKAASGRLALANPVAGKIIPIELAGNTILRSGTRFSAASATLICRLHSRRNSERVSSAERDSSSRS